MGMRKILIFTLIWSSLWLAAAWASTMSSIAKERVNVRSQPGLRSQVLFQAGLGYPVEVEKRQQEWVYIHDWQERAGWVNKSLLSKVQTAVVAVDHANIRKGPAVGKPVVMQASKGDIFKVFGEKGHWVKVGYYLENEVIGWVREDLVWGD
jgi:uncharacterized protein YgiM (DUF1202 family)